MKRNLSSATAELILHGNLFRAILAIAVPVVVTSFLQTLYNLTDTYWLGQIGTEPLAAINLVTPVQNIVLNFGSGLTVAGAVMISQYIGAQKPQEAGKMANQIFLCAMLFSLVCVAVLVLATPAIVAWLGADGATYTHSVTYLRLVMLDMPFLFMMNIYQAVRQAQGDTLRPMLLNLVGISLNLVLDPLLMITWGMSSAGAALATVLSKAVPAGIAFCLLRRPGQDIRLQAASMRPERDKLMAILRIGLPTALGGSTMQLGFLLMSRSVYVYGVNAMAAYGIGNKVNGLISLPSNAIGSAVGTIVGQNMGAKQPERAAKGYRLAMYCAIGFLFVGGQLLALRPVSQAIVSIFASDADVIAMAADFLSLMAAWCWTNGIYNATSGLFQGAGHTEVTMAVDASRLWVFRFATLYFCQNLLHMGVESVWYSVVISNGISSAILLGLYFSGLWRKSRFKTDA